MYERAIIQNERKRLRLLPLFNADARFTPFAFLSDADDSSSESKPRNASSAFALTIGESDVGNSQRVPDMREATGAEAGHYSRSSIRAKFDSHAYVGWVRPNSCFAKPWPCLAHGDLYMYVRPTPNVRVSRSQSVVSVSQLVNQSDWLSRLTGKRLFATDITDLQAYDLLVRRKLANPCLHLASAIDGADRRVLRDYVHSMNALGLSVVRTVFI